MLVNFIQFELDWNLINEPRLPPLPGIRCLCFLLAQTSRSSYTQPIKFGPVGVLCPINYGHQ